MSWAGMLDIFLLMWGGERGAEEGKDVKEDRRCVLRLYKRGKEKTVELTLG